MKKVRISYFFIVFLFLLLFSSSRAHSLFNIEGVANYAYEIGSQSSTVGYGGGIGIDLKRLSPSVLLQLRITMASHDFTFYSDSSVLNIVDAFLGTRFIFGNDNFPNWLSLYFDAGLVFIMNMINVGESDFAIDVGLGFGVEFFIWQGLYLGISMHLYFVARHYPIVGPVIGYRVW